MKRSLSGAVALLLACHQGGSKPLPPPSATADTSTSAAASAPASASVEQPQDAGAPRTVTSTVAASSNALGGDLYSQLKVKPGNLFYSPGSLSMALMMAYGGSGGATKAAMAKVLHLDSGATQRDYGGLVDALSSAPPGPSLRLANRFYADSTLPVVPAYLSLTRDVYSAPLELVDFKGHGEAARLNINGWVEAQTNARIKDLLPPNSIDPSVRLVLVNAIFFKGTWAKPFETTRTKPETFHGAGGAKSAATMHLSLDAKYGSTRDFEVLELPYADPSHAQALAMDIVLPRQRSGLPGVEAIVAAQGLDAVTSKALRGMEFVDVALPKLDVTVDFDLSQPLTALGMGIAFGDSADLTGIARTEPPLHVSKVLHKAFVQVDEEGTEAAAATGLMGATGMGAAPVPKPFAVDHPFLFVIRDTKSGVVLFVGRINDV